MGWLLRVLVATNLIEHMAKYLLIFEDSGVEQTNEELDVADLENIGQGLLQVVKFDTDSNEFKTLMPGGSWSSVNS